MSGDSTGGTATQSRTLGQRLKRGFESKILVPAAATIVSAAASYLARKLPLILEEKVLPKLREKGAPQTVTNVLEHTSAALGADTTASTRSGGRNGKSRQDESSAEAGSDQAPDVQAPSMSTEEREEERRKREERRRERKRAPEKAA
jgi:hypothetical protein